MVATAASSSESGEGCEDEGEGLHCGWCWGGGVGVMAGGCGLFLVFWRRMRWMRCMG